MKLSAILKTGQILFKAVTIIKPKKDEIRKAMQAIIEQKLKDKYIK